MRLICAGSIYTYINSVIVVLTLVWKTNLLFVECEGNFSFYPNLREALQHTLSCMYLVPGIRGCCVRLNTRLHVVLNIRMCGAIPPLHPIYSHGNTLIKHRDKCFFTFSSFIVLFCHLALYM